MLLSFKNPSNKKYKIKCTLLVPYVGIGFSVTDFFAYKHIWEGKKASHRIICRMLYVIEHVLMSFSKR